MVDDLRKRYDDSFSHFFTADAAQGLPRRDLGQLLRRRPDRDRGPEGAAGRQRASRHARPSAPGSSSGDLIVAVDGESIAGVPSEVSTAQIKGPPGTEVDLRVDPRRRRPSAHRDARARRRPRPGGPRQDPPRRPTATRSPTSASSPSARAPTASCATEVERLDRLGRRGPGARHARQRRRPAERGGALDQRLPRGRQRRLDPQPHPGRPGLPGDGRRDRRHGRRWSSSTATPPRPPRS